MATKEELLAGDDRTLFSAVVDHLYKRWSVVEFDSLSEVQRVVWSVWEASGLIGNRGFYDHDPETMARWAAAYETLGMTSTAITIREAAKIMLVIDFENNDPLESELDPLEKDYYSSDLTAEHLVANYIRTWSEKAFEG